jgi:uncharacterized protein (UPF0335 family)
LLLGEVSTYIFPSTTGGIMARFGGVSADQLKQYIERIERLETEKQQVAEYIKEAFAEAKSNGFDTKIMKQVMKLRKMEASDREEQDYILATYMVALGMAPAFEVENQQELEAA